MDEQRAVLTKFLDNLQKGVYDNLKSDREAQALPELPSRDTYDAAVERREEIRREKENKLAYVASDNNSELTKCGDMHVVLEKDVQGGYIAIEANGWLFDNTNSDSHKKVIDCCVENFALGIAKLNLDKKLYFSRYE